MKIQEQVHLGTDGGSGLGETTARELGFKTVALDINLTNANQVIAENRCRRGVG